MIIYVLESDEIVFADFTCFLMSPGQCLMYKTYHKKEQVA